MDSTIVRNSDWYATYIQESWRNSVVSIIETGQRIAEAKDKLPHGEFLNMVEEKLPFGKRDAQRLMAINNDTRISNATHVSFLPPSYGTLYEITRLTDDQFASALSQGVITPTTQRSQIAAFRKSPRQTQATSPPCRASDLNEIASTGEKYGTIYADPAWPYGNQGTRAATNNHYPTMSLDDICDLPVEDIAADDAHLHIWTTNAFLFDTKHVIEAWGFEYKSCLVWVKPQMGIGNYWRVSHEFLLTAVRGSCVFADKSLRSWVEADRTTHSQKPECIRSMIENASPGPYIELFARFIPPGWSAWGNQIETGVFDHAT